MAKCDPYTENPPMVPYLKYLDYPSEDEEELRDAYKSFAIKNANEELHLYLVSLAANNVFDDNGNPLISYDDESYGITIYEAKKLLEYYLYNVIGFTRDQVEVGIATSTGKITQDSELFQIIKEKVSNGIPVYYRADQIIDDQSTSTTKTLGHAMIAYRYLPNENKIKLHLGYKDRYDKNLPGVEYDTDAGIIWLDIKDSLPHKCANHYTWWPTKELVCSCVAYGDRHPAHSHKIPGAPICSESEIYSECSCGAWVQGTHTYNHANYDDCNHWYECACGDKDGIEAHDITYTSYDNTTHSGYCNGCGYTFTSTAHTYSYKYTTDLYHTCTCPCGKKKTEMHTKRAVDNRYAACRECDHVFDTWNDHMILKREDEETVE